MAEIRHLDSPPITEALLDFRVKLPANFDLESFSELHERLGSKYPKRHLQRYYLGEFNIVDDEHIQTVERDSGKQGYWYKSADEKEIAQFRLDGFTFNKLAPYSSWDEILAEVKNLWAIYEDVANPEAILRLSTRYINHIKLPQGEVELDDYFIKVPSVADELPQVYVRFVSQVTVFDQRTNSNVNITQSLRGTGKPFIIDIEAYKNNSTGFESNEVWGVFEDLRELKNIAFFKSVTEKTLNELCI